MLMKTAIEDFVLYLEAERGYSTQTAKSYRSDLCLLCEHLLKQKLGADIGDISKSCIRSWLVAMKGRGLSNNTIARRIHALRALWRYLLETEVTEDDPLRGISVPKRERSIPNYLHEDELRAILDAAQQHRDVFVAFRNYALMAVCIYTGVRRSELINLRLRDVDLDEGIIRVHGKARKWRVLPLAEEALTAVADWCELRPKNCPHDYLFTTVRGNRIHPSRMQRIWRSILERSGVSREGVSLHTLRHSAATILLQSGTCDIVQIQRLLGHSRLDTTAIYLHLEPGDLRHAMMEHPLAVGRGATSESR